MTTLVAAFGKFFGKLPSNRVSRPLTNRRFARLESLEMRAVLTGEIIDDLGTAPAPVVEIAPSLQDSLAAQPMGPAELVVDGSGGGSSFAPGPGPGGPPPNAAPVIHDFDYSYDNGVYTFVGTVTDDTDPFGLTINFGGLLDGKSAIVGEYGEFSFSIELENPNGGATSIVQDLGGLWSNEELVYV